MGILMRLSRSPAVCQIVTIRLRSYRIRHSSHKQRGPSYVGCVGCLTTSYSGAQA